MNCKRWNIMRSARFCKQMRNSLHQHFQSNDWSKNFLCKLKTYVIMAISIQYISVIGMPDVARVWTGVHTHRTKALTDSVCVYLLSVFRHSIGAATAESAFMRQRQIVDELLNLRPTGWRILHTQSAKIPAEIKRKQVYIDCAPCDTIIKCNKTQCFWVIEFISSLTWT